MNTPETDTGTPDGTTPTPHPGRSLAFEDGDLPLQEWLPSDKPGASSSDTVHMTHHLPDSGAAPWSSIARLESAKDVESYTTTVTADTTHAKASAVLDLGEQPAQRGCEVVGSATR